MTVPELIYKHLQMFTFVIGPGLTRAFHFALTDTQYFHTYHISFTLPSGRIHKPLSELKLAG